MSLDLLQRHGNLFTILEKFAPRVIWSDRYITLLWLVVGLPGNILSFLLWKTPRLQHVNTAAPYLAALSLNDLCLLLMIFVSDLKHAWNVSFVDVPILCETFNILVVIPQILSPILVLVLTLQQWINVTYQDKSYCISKRPRCTILVSLFTAIGLGLVHAFSRRRINSFCSVTSLRSPMIHIIYSLIVELTVNALVPLIVLSLNVLLIQQLQRIKWRMKMFELRCSSLPQISVDDAFPVRRPRDMNNSQMLHAVSFLMIVTALPLAMVNAIHALAGPGPMNTPDDEVYKDPQWQQYFAMQLVKSVTFELSLAHAACNFFIYVCSCSTFKRQFIRLLSCKSVSYNDYKCPSSVCDTSLYDDGPTNSRMYKPLGRQAEHYDEIASNIFSQSSNHNSMTYV